MKRIYLDQNIWSDIQFERFNTSLDDILKKMDRNKVEVIYSPAHCEEICDAYCCLNISKNISIEEKDIRLNLLSTVTQNKEIIPYRNNFNVMHSFCETQGPYIVLEHPAACFKRVHDNYESNKIAESAQQHSVDVAKTVSKNIKDRLGNANINDVFETDPQAKNLLIHNLTTKLIHNAAFNQLHESNIKVHPCGDLEKRILDHKIQKIRSEFGDGYWREAMLLLHSRSNNDFSSMGFDTCEAVVDSVMLSMIELGYASSEPSRSSLHDITHAIYGVYCDYFVSRDNKLLKKLIPTYEYLGVKTRIINANSEDWQAYLS